VQYIENFLKGKALWQFTKNIMPNLEDEHKNFMVNGKKDEAIRVIMTYISREIYFHISRVDYLEFFWKKLKKLFNKVDGS
jgi:hypothetical protein